MTEADDESSVAEIESGAGFKISDVVKTIAAK